MKVYTKEARNTKVYYTPEWCTQSLLDEIKFDGEIWEIAAGDGAIVNVLHRNGYTVRSLDIRQYSFKLDEVVDFHDKAHRMKKSGEKIPNVVTNPPFCYADDWVEYLMEICSGKFCFLLPLRYLEGEERYPRIFDRFPPTAVLVSSKRVTMYPFGLQTGGSSTMAVAWYLWDVPQVRPDRRPEIYWVATNKMKRKINWSF